MEFSIEEILPDLKIFKKSNKIKKQSHDLS